MITNRFHKPPRERHEPFSKSRTPDDRLLTPRATVAQPCRKTDNGHCLNLGGLNLAITSAVQFGLRYPASACQLSLDYLACPYGPVVMAYIYPARAANLWKPIFGSQALRSNRPWRNTLRGLAPPLHGDAAPSFRADSVSAS